MKFKEFSKYLLKLEITPSRNEMTCILAELFKKLERDEVKQAVYLIQGRVTPLYIPVEYNFSEKLLLKAISKYQNINILTIQKLFSELGDIGLTAENALKKKTGKNIELIEVFNLLKQIALKSGKNSQSDKQKLFIELALRLSPVELKFVSRIIVGKLRLGLSNKTILDALSWAITNDKSLRNIIEHSFGISADLGLIAEKVLFKGIGSIKKLRLTVGIPLASKLVEREKNTKKIFERLGSCFIQPKYDGLRLQIHYCKKGFDKITSNENTFFSKIEQLEQVRIFSRNMENITDMFPDIVEQIKKIKVDSIILDGEALAYDKASKKLLSFQETITRKRKFGITKKVQELPLRVYCFDLMMLNGEDLLKAPLVKRFSLLTNVFKRNAISNIILSRNISITKVDQLQDYFIQFLKEGLEGLIAKDMNSIYEPGTRNYDWIKLKGASDSELADTIDAVVLGYYKGAGVRAKFGIGAILVGIFDEDADEFLSLAKIGTGIKDKDWEQYKQKLDQLKLDSVPENVKISKNLVPDIIVSPEIVVVVEADQITKSKLHKSDYSLRFPRLKKFDRDKRADQITTLKEIKNLYKL